MFFPVIVPLAVMPLQRQKWDVGRTVDRALTHAEIERKVAADLMGVKESALSRQLAGCGPDHITLDGLSCLPVDFWVWFCLLALEKYGLFPGTRDIAARAVVGGLRMARAALKRKDGSSDRHHVVA